MEPLVELGFSKSDILLIQLCPIAAILGGLVRFIVLDTNFSRLPTGGRWHKPMTAMSRFKWIIGHVFISAVLGLLIAFYFVGTLTESPSGIAKLAAFSILLGYAAPQLWKSQEKVVAEIVEKKLKEALEFGSLTGEVNQTTGERNDQRS